MTIAVVLGAPTGPTGNVQGVNIFANITGASGQYKRWTQATGVTGAHGQFKRVYNIGASGIKGEHKTIIIPGYVGPTGS
jgi:hypothetical protein